MWICPDILNFDHFVLGTNWEMTEHKEELHCHKADAALEEHCTTLQCHSVYGESVLYLNFPHTEPTQNEIPLTQSIRRMRFPSRRAYAEWESPHAEPTQDEIPPSQSRCRVRFPSRKPGAEWDSPHAESTQDLIPLPQSLCRMIFPSRRANTLWFTFCRTGTEW